MGKKILFFNYPKQNNQSGFSNMGNSANLFMYANQHHLINNLVLAKSFFHLRGSLKL